MIKVTKYPDEWVVRHTYQQNHSLKNINEVEVRHIPSGLCATCNVYQSTHKNKNLAMDAIMKQLNGVNHE